MQLDMRREYIYHIMLLMKEIIWQKKGKNGNPQIQTII